ncbi:MAG TPA: succinate dehydrogenase assembly factor 2 [Aliiroseovarius sp.]|nr:succinate dehydrogenase assembly factor 2 [Aliiroseovarius sp.]
MTESHEHRLKRMDLRAHRRGTKEMDLVLGRFATDRLQAMDAAALDHFDRLLEEGDNDLWSWITGQVPTPPVWAELIAEIRTHAGLRKIA